MQRGQMKLLADAVHFFPDDIGDFEHRALAEKEEGVNACGELPDVTRTKEKLVAGNFGVSRGLAQRGNEDLRPAMHGRLSGILS